MSSVSISINRKLIVRCCKNRGWTIQPNALQYMIECITDNDNDNSNVNEQTDAIQCILDMISQYMIKNQSSARIITKDIVMEATNNSINNNSNKPNNSKGATSTNDTSLSFSSSLLKENSNNPSNNNNNSNKVLVDTSMHNNPKKSHASYYDNNNDSFEVINAFDTMPRLTYDETRHQFNIQEVMDSESTSSLFGTAEDKIAMFAERYTLIHQRLLRHPLFRPSILSKLPSSSSNSGKKNTFDTNVQHKLTPIESLLGGGTGGGTIKKQTTVLLLGILVQIEENQYYLEDLTGYVTVVFNESIDIDGFFITEHCIVLVEGYYYDTKFYINRLGHPLIESRTVSLNAIQQQLSHSFFSNNTNNTTTRSLSSSHKYKSASSIDNNNSKSLSFVIVSDICMDHPRVLQKLESIFARYANNNNTTSNNLPCFILMGNFVTPTSLLVQQQQHQQQQQMSSSTSSSLGTNNRTVTAIEELILLIEKFTILAKYAHFVLVPGPNDYSILGTSNLHVLPLPPLSSIMKRTIRNININTRTNTKIITNLQYGSNPCRIRWNCKEIVIFRYDLLPIFQQNEVLVPKHHISSTSGGDDDSMNISMSQDDVIDLDSDNNDQHHHHHRLPSCRLVKTILDQGHLLPIPNQPIYWNYDSSLRLYPLPDALILGGNNNYTTTGNTAYEPFHEIYSGCHVISPGSLINSILLSDNNNTTTQSTSSTLFNNKNKNHNPTTASPSSYAYFTLDDNTNNNINGGINNVSSQTTINDTNDHEILNDASTVDFLQ